MVYTVTFNPALGYVVRMDGFRAGDINRTRSEEIQFGGKGIDVSTVLRNLGVETVALGFLAGFTGQALERGLRESGIHTDFIWLPQGLTRINVKIKAGEETEINGQGPVIPPAALEELFRKLDWLQNEDVLDLSGSIPASLPDDVYQKILAGWRAGASSPWWTPPGTCCAPSSPTSPSSSSPTTTSWARFSARSSSPTRRS